MDYPKRFEHCPCCGSKERIIENEVKSEIEAGHLRKDAKIPVLATQAQVIDLQDKNILITRRQFPLLIGLYDVCSNCGTLYCVEMVKHIGIAEAHIKSQAPGYNPFSNMPHISN